MREEVGRSIGLGRGKESNILDQKEVGIWVMREGDRRVGFCCGLGQVMGGWEGRGIRIVKGVNIVMWKIRIIFYCIVSCGRRRERR